MTGVVKTKRNTSITSKTSKPTPPHTAHATEKKLQLRTHALRLPCLEQRDDPDNAYVPLLERLPQRLLEPLLRVRHVPEYALLVVDPHQARAQPVMGHALPQDRRSVHHGPRREHRGDDGEDVDSLLGQRAGQAVEDVKERDGLVLARHCGGQGLEDVVLEELDLALVARAHEALLGHEECVRVEVEEGDALRLCERLGGGGGVVPGADADLEVGGLAEVQLVEGKEDGAGAAAPGKDVGDGEDEDVVDAEAELAVDGRGRLHLRLVVGGCGRHRWYGRAGDGEEGAGAGAGAGGRREEVGALLSMYMAGKI